VPFDKSKYPPEWPQIRQRILERDGHRCQECGVANHAIGQRDANGVFHELVGDGSAEALEGGKVIRIVLTIAHLHDPDPLACDDSNLAALCQYHHLRLDASMHGRRAAETKARRKRERMLEAGQLELQEAPL